MTNCIPCPPCEEDLPLTCEPYGTVSVGNRAVVEDDAFCTKTLTNPATKSWLIWDNGIKWEEYAALTGPLTTNSTILATGNSSKIGYNTGAGGSITQGAGAKTNAVTLNRPTGIIVTDNANLAADTSVTFNLSNSVIEAEDIVLVSHIAGGTLGSYNFAVAPAAGNANITIRNITAGALAEALTLRFIVMKSVNS